VLAALSAEEYRSLVPHLAAVPLEFKEVLYEQGDRTDSVYFVETGVVSLVIVMREGEVETGTVGNEGAAGVHGFLADGKAHERAVCQVPGSALRLSLDELRRQPHDGTLHRQLYRYVAGLMAMLSQNAACNRAHTLEQRMSRWLLMTLDRVGRPEFSLTQEFMAQMLGVRRPTVSLTGAALQRAGLIRYTRGRITIVDRRGLESTACECYERIRREFDRALGGAAKSPARRGSRA
jgi:CRP-like cAMP-binding protein